MTAPGPPWQLRGECAVALVPTIDAPMAAGFQGVPGPSLFMFARYTDSPVGPYLELAVARPARIRARVAFFVTTMAVTSDASVIGGRSNWGFPKELSALSWTGEEDGSVVLRAEQLGMQAKARPGGPEIRLVAPIWCLQQRDGGPVQVLGWLRGRCRLAGVDVDSDASDRLQFVHGRHRGMVVTGLRLVINAAHRIDHS